MKDAVVKKIVSRNAIFAVVEIVVNSIVLFVLYKYLIFVVGIDDFGTWSIVMASANALRAGELGLSGSVIKYVAKYISLDKPKAVSEIIQTGVMSLGVILTFFLIGLYPLLRWVFGYIFSGEALEIALLLLPFSLLYLWLSTINGVFQSGLDGCLRTDLRSLMTMSGSIIYLILAFVFVPQFGLIGLVYSQLIQKVLSGVFGWILLRRELNYLPLFPYYWSWARFKEMFQYGANLQVIAITVILFEPTTKMLLGKFGGLSMTGYFEMAHRLIIQIRSLLLSANLVLVPVVAQLQEINSKKIHGIYKANINLIAYIAFPAYAGVVAWGPVISELWIGRYEAFFVRSLYILAFGAVINVFAGPAYFNNLGAGKLKWNVIAHIGMTSGNFVLGLILGEMFGGLGVVVTMAIVIILGGIAIVIEYHIRNQASFKILVSKEILNLVWVCGIAVGVSWGGYYFIGEGVEWVNLWMIVLLPGLFILPGLWFHPQRKVLFSYLTEGLAK